MSMDVKRKQSVPTKYDWIRDAVRTASFFEFISPFFVVHAWYVISVRTIARKLFKKRVFKQRKKTFSIEC
jgi:hypothetical protein